MYGTALILSPPRGGVYLPPEVGDTPDIPPEVGYPPVYPVGVDG